MVSNDSRWYFDSGAGGHWLEVQLKTSFAVGSAHLYTGLDDTFAPRHIEIQ